MQALLDTLIIIGLIIFLFYQLFDELKEMEERLTDKINKSKKGE